ncbi:MAG: porin family protein [Bacteroidales bacterium]|nr:porin family protein [Bacteroidales bacterium]
MRKFFTIICAAIIMMAVSASAKAQCAFPEGTVGINLGVGVGTSDYHGWDGHNHHYDNITVPTFNFALDYGFLPNVINGNSCISGGGYASFGRGSAKANDWKNIVGQWKVGTRGALHYTWVRNLDTYAGIGIGAKHESGKGKYLPSGDKTPKDSKTDFDCFGFGGARYIMGNFSVYLEISTTNISWGQMGISFVL